MILKDVIMTTKIKCNNAHEFNTLVNYIFFSDTRAKRHSQERTSLEYETVQEALGIAQAEHDKADENYDDIEVDLLAEYLAGNHKFINQTYPVYVEWEFEVWGCESWARSYIFHVYDDTDIMLETLLENQIALEIERNEIIALTKKIKQYSI